MLFILCDGADQKNISIRIRFRSMQISLKSHHFELVGLGEFLGEFWGWRSTSWPPAQRGAAADGHPAWCSTTSCGTCVGSGVCCSRECRLPPTWFWNSSNKYLISVCVFIYWFFCCYLLSAVPFLKESGTDPISFSTKKRKNDAVWSQVWIDL